MVDGNRPLFLIAHFAGQFFYRELGGIVHNKPLLDDVVFLVSK